MRIRVSTCNKEPIYAILTVNVPLAEDNMILVIVFLLPCYDFGYLCKRLDQKISYMVGACIIWSRLTSPGMMQTCVQIGHVSALCPIWCIEALDKSFSLI